MIVAITLIAVALAVPPSQGPKEKRTPENGGAQTASNADYSAKANQQPPQQEPSPTAQISAQASQPQATPANDDVEVQRKIEKFTGGLVIVGLLQAGVMFLTWLVYCRQAKIMARQAHEMKRQRAYMRLQWRVMERQINKERARIRIDLKPLKLQEPDPGDGETVQVINYTVTFYGFTYAFIDEDAFGVWLSDSPKEEERGFGRIGGGPSKVIDPGTKPDERIEMVETTKFEVDSLMHGKSFIHFSGRIKYRDFAEVERETTIYCVWQSWGPRKGKPPGILAGSGRWEKSGPPEANHET